MLHTLLHNQDGGKRASIVALPSGMRIICSTCLFPLIYHPQTSLEQLLPLTFICLGCQSGTDVTDCHTTCQPMSTPVLDKRGFHASSALGGLEGGVKIKIKFCFVPECSDSIVGNLSDFRVLLTDLGFPELCHRYFTKHVVPSTTTKKAEEGEGSLEPYLALS
eukprot:6184910-Pleurochrysis_carterae.AAC.4